ncbi:hypothetical protein A2U01_0079155, partial [Trifolium medium]|nr:hypothetical protein [Trifolium medium]
RISDFRGVSSPWPLPNAAVADFCLRSRSFVLRSAKEESVLKAPVSVVVTSVLRLISGEPSMMLPKKNLEEEKN